MSKLNTDTLKKGIGSILEGSKENRLKDDATQRDERFAGTVKLPHAPRP